MTDENKETTTKVQAKKGTKKKIEELGISASDMDRAMRVHFLKGPGAIKEEGFENAEELEANINQGVYHAVEAAKPAACRLVDKGYDTSVGAGLRVLGTAGGCATAALGIYAAGKFVKNWLFGSSEDSDAEDLGEV